MEFRHEVVDKDPPCSRQMVCQPTDLTGNGTPDVIIAGNEPEPKLYWYERPGWECHVVHEGRTMCPGADLADLTGNGRLDLVAGGPWGSHHTFWFEQPADPRDPWERHGICEDFHKYHDQAVADVDDDGELEVLLVSQNAEIVCYYEVPDDPTGSGWSRKNRTFVAAGVGDAEGIVVTDLDGDGRTELVVGRRIFHREDDTGDAWRVKRVAPDWVDERVRVAADDLDSDGATELVLAECELPALGERHDLYHDARLGICAGLDWEARILRDDLHCPHTLQLADFTGSGTQDIYVAESDFGGHEHPRHFIYRNQGNGEFDRTLIHEGTGTHQAKAVDLTGNGRPDIVGKNDAGAPHVDVWYNES